jgi:hypothetical protein
MTSYKVAEIYFKENSGEIEAVINREAEDGWKFVSLSTYSTLNDWWKKAHAVIVFSKKS